MVPPERKRNPGSKGPGFHQRERNPVSSLMVTAGRLSCPRSWLLPTGVNTRPGRIPVRFPPILEQRRTQQEGHRSSQMGVNRSGVDPRQIHGLSEAPRRPNRGLEKLPNGRESVRGGPQTDSRPFLDVPGAQKGIPRCSRMAVNLSGVDPRQIHAYFGAPQGPNRGPKKLPNRHESVRGGPQAV